MLSEATQELIEVVAIYSRHQAPEVVMLVDTYGDVGSIPAGRDCSSYMLKP